MLREAKAGHHSSHGLAGRLGNWLGPRFGAFVCMVIWLAIGLMAFWVRLTVPLLARAQAAVTRAEADLTAIEGDLAQAEQEAKQHHEAAVIRVERIHEYIHRRLAVYRRALVRAHPDGAWANAALSVRAPEIPGWALPDAYLPDNTVPQPPKPPETGPPERGETPPPEPSVRIIELQHEVTRFGSDKPVDPEREIGYETLDAPIAAPWHFTVVKMDGLLHLRTRGYGHGPYIAGEVVGGTAVLEPGDFFDFADRRYTMLDADRLEDAPLGKCELIAAGLSATSGSKPRLSGMSFVQREKTLLAVLGPSGAGKSSLFEALLRGASPPVRPAVLPRHVHGHPLQADQGAVRESP
jgi:ABC transport system ATP-binding/permease protein